MRRVSTWLLIALAALAASAQEIPAPEKRGDVVPPPDTTKEDEGDWEIIEDIVVWVNDDIITVSDVAEADAELSQALMSDLSGNELEKAIDEARAKLLYNLINRRLLIQEASRLYDMDKVKASLIDNFKERQGIKTEEDMNRFLRAQGMTREELEEKLVSYSVPGFVQSAEVDDRLAVSDDDVKAYFEAHEVELTEEPRFSFREIVLRDDGAGDASRERAGKVAADARSGVDFEELVAQVSEAPSKDKGGLVGPLPRSDLAGWLADALAPLQPGEVSDPIRTPYGWLVVRMESREEGKGADLEQDRNRIEKLIRDERYPAALQAYLDKIWRQSEIVLAERFVDRLPAEWRGRVQTRP